MYGCDAPARGVISAHAGKTFTVLQLELFEKLDSEILKSAFAVIQILYDPGFAKVIGGRLNDCEEFAINGDVVYDDPDEGVTPKLGLTVHVVKELF